MTSHSLASLESDDRDSREKKSGNAGLCHWFYFCKVKNFLRTCIEGSRID